MRDSRVWIGINFVSVQNIVDKRHIQIERFFRQHESGNRSQFVLVVVKRSVESGYALGQDTSPSDNMCVSQYITLIERNACAEDTIKGHRMSECGILTISLQAIIQTISQVGGNPWFFERVQA